MDLKASEEYFTYRPTESTIMEQENPTTNGNSLHEPFSDIWEMKQLFGGAITSLIPKSFEDVSIIRQVPDHQEVFVDKYTEMSLIVELMQADESVSDELAAAHYFEDLSICNEVWNSMHDYLLLTAAAVCISMYLCLLCAGE